MQARTTARPHCLARSLEDHYAAPQLSYNVTFSRCCQGSEVVANWAPEANGADSWLEPSVQTQTGSFGRCRLSSQPIALLLCSGLGARHSSDLASATFEDRTTASHLSHHLVATYRVSAMPPSISVRNHVSTQSEARLAVLKLSRTLGFTTCCDFGVVRLVAHSARSIPQEAQKPDNTTSTNEIQRGAFPLGHGHLRRLHIPALRQQLLGTGTHALY